MTPVTLDGFLSKKQIEASFGRSYRSLTRDITRAVKTGNAAVLQHLKLVTEDDQVREGTDVTLELIQDLSNHGMRPTWLADESWVADWCARRQSGARRTDPRDEPPADAEPVPVAPPSASDSGPVATPTSPATVDLLKQRIDDQKQQIDFLRGQVQIKDGQLRTANQLAEQSQQLMRDLHVLLKNVQDGLLGEGTGRLISARTTSPRQPSSAADQPTESSGPAPDTQSRRDADSAAARSPSAADHDARAATKSKSAVPSRKRRRPKSTASPKRPRRRPPTSRHAQQKAATNRDEKRPVGLVDKHLPTISGAIRSFFRK